MKVLFLAARFPRPPLRGDQSRAFHQLRILGSRHDITLISFVDGPIPEADLQRIESFCRRVVLVPRSPLSRLHLLRAPFTRLPLQTLLYRSAAYAAAVDRELRSGDYDLVHLQLIRMCPYGDRVLQPRVVDFIDALSVNMDRRAATERPWLRPVVRFEAARVRRYERDICRRFEEILVVSPQDRDAIGDFPNLHVTPVGIEPEALTVPPLPRDEDHLVFAGTMDYFPNVDAAKFLVRDILPIIREERPDVRVTLVGATPSRAVRALARTAGVEVTGSVPTVFPYLQRATVSIDPMRTGSGMQFKVIEAMAVGTPVVTTPRGIGGLDVTPGLNVLVGTDAQSIANHTLALLRDRALAQRIGRAGEELVRERYTWEASVERQDAIWRAATRQSSREL